MNRIWPAVGLLLCAACMGGTGEDSSAMENSPIEIEVEEANFDSLKRENDSLKELVKEMKSLSNIDFEKAFDSIEDPQEYIIKRFRERPELIPEKGVLGGEMKVVETDVLNKRFLWVAYEDGHIHGEALYAFKLQKNGDLEFQLLTKLKD